MRAFYSNMNNIQKYMKYYKKNQALQNILSGGNSYRILVVQFARSSDILFSNVDENFCDTEIKHEYAVRYIKFDYDKYDCIGYDDDQRKNFGTQIKSDVTNIELNIAEFNPTVCIVYIPEYYFNNDNSQKLCNEIKDKHFKCNTIIYYEVDKASIDEEIMSEIQASTDNTTIYNFAYETDVHKVISFKKYILNDSAPNSYAMFVPSKIQYAEHGVKILPTACAWWVKLTIEKLNCNKKKLFQYFGTCYLNAVLNGLILSDDISNIIISKMNIEIQSDEEIREYILGNINEHGRCPINNSDVTNYIYKIIYNLKCIEEKKPLTIYHTDAIIELSKKFSIRPPEPIKGTIYVKETSGVGGESIPTLYNILERMNITFAKFKNINEFVSSDINKENCPEIICIATILNERMEQKREEIKSDKVKLSDIEEYNNNIINEKTITNKYGISYTLNFCVLSIKFTSGTGHAICCFMCNGIYKIYDSGTNSLFTFDWLHCWKEEEKENKIKLSKKIGEHWKKTISSMHILVGVYVCDEKDKIKAKCFVSQI